MCLYCDCITSWPSVLITLDVLQNSDSNGMCSCPFITEQLPHLVLSTILGAHALTGCDDILPLSGKRKN